MVMGRGFWSHAEVSAIESKATSLGIRMIITFLAPFRNTFSLPKQAALACHSCFAEIVSKARRDVAHPPNLVLGNYGWSRPCGSDADGAKPTHGELGVDDPTIFFRDMFTASVQFSLGAEDMPSEPWSVHSESCERFRQLLLDSSNVACVVRIMDNTVGVVSISAKVDTGRFCAFFGNDSVDEPTPAVIEFGTQLVQRVIDNRRAEIDQGLVWVRESIAKPLARAVGDGSDVFSKLGSPLYPAPDSLWRLTPMWVHCVLAATPQERTQLEVHKRSLMRLFSSPELAENWFAGQSNAYGWGVSAVTTERRYGEQWLDAIILSQFYYACFEIADVALPMQLAEARSNPSPRDLPTVISRLEGIRYAIRFLQGDYSDLRVRSSSEGRRALECYYLQWRFDKLLEGLDRKLDLAAETSAYAAEVMTRHNEHRLQLILTAITLLSLISVFSGVHTYLADGYDPDAPSWLLSHAYALSRVVVVFASLGVASLAIFAWLLSRR